MSDLRTRLVKVFHDAATNSCATEDDWNLLADAVIRELTDAIPPIVATAIRGYVVAELAAISYHGEVAEYEMLKRLDREALQIARYATTHKDWNG